MNFKYFKAYKYMEQGVNIFSSNNLKKTFHVLRYFPYMNPSKFAAWKKVNFTFTDLRANTRWQCAAVSTAIQKKVLLHFIACSTALFSHPSKYEIENCSKWKNISKSILECHGFCFFSDQILNGMLDFRVFLSWFTCVIQTLRSLEY